MKKYIYLRNLEIFETLIKGFFFVKFFEIFLKIFEIFEKKIDPDSKNIFGRNFEEF